MIQTVTIAKERKMTETVVTIEKERIMTQRCQFNMLTYFLKRRLARALESGKIQTDVFKQSPAKDDNASAAPFVYKQWEFAIAYYLQAMTKFPE